MKSKNGNRKAKSGNPQPPLARPHAVVADAILNGIPVSRYEVRQLAIGYQILSKLVGDQSAEHSEFNSLVNRQLSHLKATFRHLQVANEKVHSVSPIDRDKNITSTAALTWERAGNFVDSVWRRLFPVDIPVNTMTPEKKGEA